MDVALPFSATKAALHNVRVFNGYGHTSMPCRHHVSDCMHVRCDGREVDWCPGTSKAAATVSVVQVQT